MALRTQPLVWSTALVATLLLGVVLWKTQRAEQPSDDIGARLDRLERKLDALMQAKQDQTTELLAELRTTAARQAGTRSLHEPDGREASGGDQNEDPASDDFSVGEIEALLAEMDEKLGRLVGEFEAARSGTMTFTGRSAPPRTMTGSNPGELHWSANQVLGEPDTFENGDLPTAWTTQGGNSGEQWIEVGYDRSVVANGALIRETYNPGAVVRVEAIDASGNYHTVWEGDDPTTESPGDFEIDFGGGVPAVGLRVTLDTNRVDGWNEIDAIGLISGNDLLWAVEAVASNSYSDGYPTPTAETPDE